MPTASAMIDEIPSIYKIRENSEKWRTKQEVNLLNNQSLVCAAKRAIFGEKSQKMTHEQNCQVLDYIVKQILEIDEATFCNIYSTASLANLKLKNLTNTIIKTAPEDIKIACAYNNKRILFASVYPDFYKEHFKPIEAKDIYYCAGDVKSSLKKAASMKLSSIRDGEETSEVTKDGIYKKERTSKAKGLHGEEIDKLLYDTLDQMLGLSGFEEFENKLSFLADVKSFYSEQSCSLPGIFSIVDARGCYDSYLDFFFLNSSGELQEAYFLEYMKIRRVHQKDNELLNTIYQAYLEEFEIEEEL